MEHKTLEVCTRENGKTYCIGNVNCEVYTTVDEALQHQGHDTVLKLINDQHKIKVMSNFRRSYKVGPSENEIAAAYTKLACAPENIQATMAAAQNPDPNVYAAYIDGLRKRVTDEINANRKVKYLKSERSVDDEDNSEDNEE